MKITNWKMNYGAYIGLACEAPCSMYSVLLKHGLIDDPYYGLNELKYTRLSDEDCTFIGTFTVEEAMLSCEHCQITFHGLDTICDIYLNDVLLDSVNDMHIAYTYEVREYLCQGENVIRLEFKSPTRYFAKKNNEYYLWSSLEGIQGAAHLRKALYMSGWDWGPRLPDMGIFRPVELRCYDADVIGEILVLQHHHEKQVEIDLSVSTRHSATKSHDLELYAVMDGQRVCLVDGKAKIIIQNPKLWWVRGYGEQHLYDLHIELVHNGQVIDRVEKRIGLRTISVSTAKDKYGNEFCFVNNGVKIFAMGANYVPQDNLLSRISKERTRKLIESCVDANFNCLRVWGGGYYPEDDFYDLCDEYGLLVWQDFMVACANIRLTAQTESNFIREATYNIKRLRNHASLGLLCGNNEMEDAVMHWFYASRNALAKMDYLRLYEHILPDLCEEHAPQTFYWPSSPSSGGGLNEPTDPMRGDIHYWDVWTKNAPFTDYRKHTFRFCSEYGFQAFPSIKTIRTFCEEKDQNAFSRVMENHQKFPNGNSRLMKYIADSYLYPASFEKLVYTSQLLQADAIKYGVEHFRRHRGICMGSVYWQVNDCWPVISWASVDYYGRYKALHYAAKKFYSPVLLGLFYEDGTLEVNVSNETTGPFCGTLEVKLCRNDFSVIRSETADVKVNRLCAEDIFRMEVTPEDPYSNYLCAVLYDANGKVVMEQTELFVQPKHYSWECPDIDVHFLQREDGIQLKVSAARFAKGVEIDFASTDCVLSENFFDLTSGQSKTILIKTDTPAECLKKELIVRTVYDISQ